MGRGRKNDQPAEGIAVVNTAPQPWAILVDMSSGWCFGPCFTDGPEEALAFLAFAAETGRAVTADLEPQQLRDLYNEFIALVDAADAEGPDATVTPINADYLAPAEPAASAVE